MSRARSVLRHLGRAAAAYSVLLVALLLTLLAYDYVRRSVGADMRYQFDETVRLAQNAIEGQMDLYVDAMYGASALLYASDSVDEEEWDGYTSGIELERRYEGVQALGYAERVEPGERDDFEEREAAVRPADERDEYFPMVFVQPASAVNGELLGYDTYFDPEHREAMDRARDTGAPQSTGKVFVLSEAPPGHRADLALYPGVVLYMPVYEKGASTGTVAERRQALEGFVACYLETEGLFRDSFEKTEYGPAIDFEVYDEGGLTPNNLLYDDDGVLRAAEARYDEPEGLIGSVEEFLGLRPGTITGPPELSYDGEIELAGRGLEVHFEALLGRGGATEGGESRLPVFVLLSGLAVSLLLFVVTYLLVRSRLRAQKASRDREEANRELAATNRELEAFSYSVSHDLRAPLRSIDGFSQILLEDYADAFDEEGRDYLGRVRTASQRMGRLIDDMLGLSRVTRNTMTREIVDLSAVAREVAEGLKEARPEREVEFVAQKGLEVQGDPRLLRVALENLIGNAWKFTGKEPGARVEFGVDEELSRKGRVPVYYVRDNGAGFDMQYAGKLFGAFQRLHGANEFEGTGIGLATVQRVVHRHGGRIWARGEVGRGATFYFTLSPGLKLDGVTSAGAPADASAADPSAAKPGEEVKAK